MKEWKAKFDAWIVSINPYIATSNAFFILAVLNFWRVFDFFLFVFCGVLWRYGAEKWEKNQKLIKDLEAKAEGKAE
jgi:hypothetical protein